MKGVKIYFRSGNIQSYYNPSKLILLLISFVQPDNLITVYQVNIPFDLIDHTNYS